MEYGKIIAVTGMPGLYELLSSKSDGAIVRSLDDKTTKFVSSRIHNFSHLESIEIYTTRENVNLVDLFKAMEESGEALPAEKDNTALKKYFEKVYPDLDFERVYVSDMKKMVKWFSALKTNNIDIKLSEAPPLEEPAEPVEEKSMDAPVEAVAETELDDDTATATKKRKTSANTGVKEDTGTGKAKTVSKGSSSPDESKKAKSANVKTESTEEPTAKKKAAPKTGAKSSEEKAATEAPKKKAAPKKK